MTPSLSPPEIWLAVPEMVLAVFAMALLILGVCRGEGSTRLVSWLAIGVLMFVLLIAVQSAEASGGSDFTGCS